MSIYMQSAMIEEDISLHPVTFHAEQEQDFAPVGVVAEEPLDFSTDPDLHNVLLSIVPPAIIEYIIKYKILYDDVPYNIKPEDLIEVLKCGETKKINVRFIRKVLPALRVISCHKVLQYEGKRKIKGLWHDVPADWPEGLPHKDPNNAEKSKNGSGIPKANGHELKAMFQHLRMKFSMMLQREVGNLSESELSKANEAFSCSSRQPSHHIPTVVQRISDQAGTASVADMEVDRQREVASTSEVHNIWQQPTQQDSYNFHLHSEDQYMSTQESYAVADNANEKYQFTELLSDKDGRIYISQLNGAVAELEQEVTANSQVADMSQPKELSAEARVYIAQELVKLREKTGTCIQKYLGEELGLVNLMSQSFKMMESLGNSGDLQQFIAASSAMSSVLDMAVLGAIPDGDMMTRLTGIIEGEKLTATPSKLVPSTSLNNCTPLTLSEPKNAQMGQQVFTAARVQDPDRNFAEDWGIKHHMPSGTLNLLEHVEARPQKEMCHPEQWLEFKDEEKDGVLDAVLDYEEEYQMAIGASSPVLHDVNMQIASDSCNSTAANKNMSCKADQDTICIPQNPVQHYAPRIEIPPRPVSHAITSPVVQIYGGSYNGDEDDGMDCDYHR